MMSDEKDLRSKRSMAWERAKGELRSMKHTFYQGVASREGQFEELEKEMEKFIAKVESLGLHE